ncbi:MAG: hypothetical protein KF773_19220 [Deltaproteobacteria bacterium]|nr:hypothetical protein [Deltaproteobacteria bacterium]MCW5804935.1 hypothetical protein [Deltaproteobacteria bacterium]
MKAWPMFALVFACGGDPPGEVDARPIGPDADLGTDIAAVPEGCTTERATEDRPDDHRYDQIRVLYVTSADGPDLGHDTSGKICNSIRAVATWFHEQSGAYLRFDTAGGLVDIGFLRLARTDAEMAGSDPSNTSVATGHAFVRERIEQGLGLLAPNKMYAVFYEGTSVYACGGGPWPPLLVGRVGAIYLQATPTGVATPCGDVYPWGQGDLVPHYVDYAVLHELVHGLGLAPATAPHQHTTGHVYDAAAPQPNRDLMYSERPGMPDPPWGTELPGGLILDIGDDDYFNAPTPFDLASSSIIAPLSPFAHRPPGW